MKFTGLILICASSCLALILPAIGVVQFPKTTQKLPTVMQTSTFPTSTPALAANSPGSPQSSFPNSPQWMPSSPQRDFLQDSSNSTPSPFPSHSPLQLAPQLLVGEPNLSDGGVPSGQKFGIGIWLLLAPVCLIGLAMWTFSSNPSGVKKT